MLTFAQQAEPVSLAMILVARSAPRGCVERSSSVRQYPSTPNYLSYGKCRII